MGKRKEWWQDFFLRTYHRVQRGQFPEETNRKQADLIEQVLELQPGARVLDVPCGPGRLALVLAERGYAVTGVDFNPHALKDAARESKQRSLEISWVRRDMRRLPWRKVFDGAFCFFGSFGYFDECGNLAFLKAAAQALKPGGHLLVEGHCLETLLPKFQPSRWGRINKAIVLEEQTFDLARSRVESDWSFILGKQRYAHHLSMRIYSYHELCGLFEEAGFRNMHGFDTRTGKPFSMGSGRLTLVGVRR